jgi:hypothetical protein
MRRLLVASLFVCLAVATGAKANCYVLQNNTDEEQKLAFSYDTSIGPGTLRNVTIAPHDHYPSQGQWCWDRVPWKAVVRVDPGYYRRSWSGAFTMGDGDGVSPSGVYSLEPVDEAAPPSQKKAAKAQKAAKAAKAQKVQGAPAAQAAQGAQEAQEAEAIGTAPSISCVNDICDVLFQNGRVAYTDTNQQTAKGVAAIVGFKGPGSISCMSLTKQSGELCVVVDSTGQTWKGPMRPGAGAWTPWTKPPQN